MEGKINEMKLKKKNFMLDTGMQLIRYINSISFVGTLGMSAVTGCPGNA
jgi:hypothetical protein